jgi:hypothetical protein
MDILGKKALAQLTDALAELKETKRQLAQANALAEQFKSLSNTIEAAASRVSESQGASVLFLQNRRKKATFSEIE